MEELFKISNKGELSFPTHPVLIEDKRFAERLDIVEVNIPSSVLSIGVYAFENCKNISNVFIGENLQSIGDSAFKGCNKIEGIYIPKSVSYIADNAFDECRSGDNSHLYIYGYKGSYAEEYAKKKSFIKFIKLVSEEEINEAIAKYDNRIDLDKQIQIFKEAIENNYNLIVSFKGNLYMAIAQLLGRGTEQNIKVATDYSNKSYNILHNVSSLIKDETREQKEKIEKKFFDIGYEFSEWLRNMIKLINLKMLTPLDVKAELYPQELSIEEAFALEASMENDENIIEKLLSKDGLL